MNFYLDESGHNGGVSEKSYATAFDGQRIFTLAAIGLDGVEDKVASGLQKITKKHNVNLTELKASKLYKKKPNFFTDVFSLIKKEGCPIFIEAVDRKYFISTNIVSSLVMPVYSLEKETRETNFIRNVFAEYIFHNVPDNIYSNFLNLCSEPSGKILKEFLNDFIYVLENDKNEVSCALQNSLEMTLNDVNENILDDSDSDINAFLPIPDIGKRGKEVWMLPNLSSFTNIYARINLFMEKDLSNVKIFHDEQLQYDDIIEKAKRDVENFSTEKFGFVSESSDYQFTESANLFFRQSHTSIGIQISDLLAGFTMRYIRNILCHESEESTHSEANKILMSMNQENIGVGLNMVLSARDAELINSFS